MAWGNIPKNAIERIEILRGPSSTLYGSEGLGGVINNITQQPGEKRATSLQAKAGNASTFGGTSNGLKNVKDEYLYFGKKYHGEPVDLQLYTIAGIDSTEKIHS